MFAMHDGHHRSIVGVIDFNVVKSVYLLLLGRHHSLFASASLSRSETCGNHDERDSTTHCTLIFIVFRMKVRDMLILYICVMLQQRHLPNLIVAVSILVMLMCC